MIKKLAATLLSALSAPAASQTEHRPVRTDGSEHEIVAVMDAWLNLFEKQEIKMRRQLNAPATEAEIAAFERTIGFNLPAEVRSLYGFANGQKSPFKVTYRAPKAPNLVELPFELKNDEFVGNLFGSYEFLSLERAAKNWNGWAEIRAGSTPEELAMDFDDSVTVRGNDPVLKVYTHAAWIPFAEDGGGNAYAIDLAPTEGGTAGQVIAIGPDEDLRRVLAPSLTAFLKAAGRRGITIDHEDKQRVYFAMEQD